MSFLRGGDERERARSGARVIHEERRRALASGVLAAGSMACPACDAPVWPGEGAITLAEVLDCPFCRHAGAAREFLSLEQPTRPARVLVRLRWPAPVR